MRDGFVASWGEAEYEASPDGDNIRLYRPDAADGFEEVRPGRYRRVVSAAECGGIGYVRTACTWRGQPFIVLAEHQDWLRVEYTGGRAPVATTLGLEEFDYGVYQGWVPRTEIADVREQKV